jgi:hypothetical protein
MDIIGLSMRYLAQLGLIYLLLKFFPNNKMDDRSIVLISVVLLIATIIIEQSMNNNNNNNDINEGFDLNAVVKDAFRQTNMPSTSSVPADVNAKTTLTKEEPKAFDEQKMKALQDLKTEIARQEAELLNKYSEEDKKKFQERMDPYNNEPHSYNIPSSTGVRQDYAGAKERMLEEAKKTIERASGEVNVMRIAKEQTCSRATDGVIENEMKYTDYNTLQVPQNYQWSEDEYGYNFLPPTNWFPVPAHPPVCVSEKQQTVCPVFTEGASVDLKEWHDSRRITPPDRINTDYVKDKLNSGR